MMLRVLLLFVLVAELLVLDALVYQVVDSVGEIKFSQRILLGRN